MGLIETVGSNPDRTTVIVFAALLAAGMFTLGLVAFLLPWVYKVVIEGETLTRYRLDRPRSIRRSEISHFRAVHRYREESWLIIYPSDPKTKPIKINIYLERIAELRTWLSKVRSPR